VVETERYRTEVVEKSLEAEAAALTFWRPRDTQPRHISQIREHHSSALADRERVGRWGSEVGGGPPGPSGLLSFCALFWVRTRDWSQVGPPEFYDRYTVVLDFPFFIRKYVVRCGRNFNHS
jgi:hypothetical protein